MNTLTESKRADIIRALCDGNSVIATARLTRTAKATVMKSLLRVGESCAVYQRAVFSDLPTKQVVANEIWSFVGTKAKNAVPEGASDVWTHVAMDVDSKLLISWLVGPRTPASTRYFITDVANRLGNRALINMGGLAFEVAAVPVFPCSSGVKFAQLVNDHGESKHDHGSHRSIPLAYGFSRKTENHVRAVSLFFMHYNFSQAHRTLTKARKGINTTPAMAAGITDHVWSAEEILAKTDPKNPEKPR